MSRTGTGGQARRRRWVVLVALAVLCGLAPGAARAAAAPPTSFSATASAETSQVLFESASLPVASSFDVGMPGAQAVLDSLGQSRAYAAAPYPSETVVALPGLLVSSGVPLVPPYPLIVQTEAPTSTDDEISQGPLLLRVHSDQAMSTGLAQITAAPGVSESSAAATVQTSSEDLLVVATGTSVFEGLSLGDGLLRISRLESEAQASIGPDGQVAVSSRLAVTGLSISGIEVAVGQDGLVVGDNELVPISLAELNAILEAASIQLDYLAPVTDPDGLGVTAGGLRVRSVVSSGLDAPLTVTQTIGRSRARIDAVSATASPPAIGSLPVSPSPQDEGAERPPALPSTPAPAASGAPLSAASPALSGDAGPATRPIAQFELLRFYLVLVLAAGVVGGSGRLFRHVGVGRQWV